MRDPVNGFDYPEAWVKKCSSPDLLPLVENGLAVLTSSGNVIRRGFTTGTTAAAACKTAILSLAGEVVSVPVDLPCGLTVTVTVTGSGGIATAMKFAGDYPDDVTRRMRVYRRGCSPAIRNTICSRHWYWQVFTRHTPLPERRAGDQPCSL